MSGLKKINNYQIIEQLGKGGMATVYLAKHTLLDRDVALKVLVFGATDPDFRESFIKEGQIVAALKHPNIVDIYDIGIEDDQFYMVMEYVENGTLKQKFERETLTIDSILTIIDQITAALSYAHAKGYVHRDVKPENILFRDDNTSVLADFGVAKLQGTHSHLTQVGYKAGTPCYMSPEQVMGEAVDHRTDIYSLGVVLYEMLTGEKLFKGANIVSISYQHVHKKIPPLPPTYHYLQPVLNKALAKKKRSRYADVDAFAAALHATHEQHIAEYKTQYIPQNRFAHTPNKLVIESSKTKPVATKPTRSIKPAKPTISTPPTTINKTQNNTDDTGLKTLSFFNKLAEPPYTKKHPQSVTTTKKPWLTTVASLGLLFLAIGGSSYYLMNNNAQQQITSTAQTNDATPALNQPVTPASNEAVVTPTKLVAEQDKQEVAKPITKKEQDQNKDKEKEQETIANAVTAEPAQQEATKKEAEAKQIVAETETEQKEAEKKGVTAESDQKEADTNRIAAETNQKETEAKRINAETEQKETASKQLTTEVEQPEAEAKRIAAETAKKEAEAKELAAKAAEKEKAKKVAAKKKDKDKDKERTQKKEAKKKTKKNAKPNIIDQYIAQEERRLARQRAQQRAAAQRRLQQQRAAANNRTAQRVQKVRDDENIFMNYE